MSVIAGRIEIVRFMPATRPKSFQKFSLTLAQRRATRWEVSYEGAATGPDSRSKWYVIEVAASGWCALED